MAVDTKNYLDLAGLTTYDTAVKSWSNSASQVAYKSVAKSTDGNNLLFFKKPSAVVGTDTPDVTIALGGADEAAKLNALAAIVAATYDSTNKTYSISGLNTTAQNTLVAAINELLADIGDVSNLDITVGTGETAPADVVAAANLLNDHIDALANTITNLDGTAVIATNTNGVVTIKGGVKQTAGEIANKTTTEAADVTLAKVATTGAAEDVSTTAITDGAAENPQTLYAAGDVQGILEAIAQDLNALESESVVNVVKDTTAVEGYFASYTITQNGVQVGEKINIPKDYLVKSAEVKTVTTADDPYTGAEVGDKYIDFVINVKSGTATDEHIYIPVDDLMDAITGGTNAETTVAISDSNEITVTINAIAASKINFTKADSTTETVQATLTRLEAADTVAGSVDYKIKNAVTGLDTSSDVAIASYDSTTTAITIQNGVKQEDGVIAQGTGDGIVIAPIADSAINGLFS